eukprot:CAMPEP_0201564650 /NCGR_PEP_ID=MMETSP0190_2-20130828/3150_1 /ASSEMBLY_ACC=CAM_ASM_000263 /TAXON_ID=37353 /ORGANISM="Rosalina sp." /LENGTH=124 /DNA_ID=CAMNT_0047981121 /DNA_START=112 /DNA_END=486 /DNA_ORIENTATION=+
MSIIEIKQTEKFDEIVEKAKADKKLIIAKFGAKWCKPCKEVAPHYKEFAGKYQDMIFLDVDFDTDDNEELADDWKVKKLPMFIVIKEGKEHERLQHSDKDKLLALISKQFKEAAKSAFSMDEDF